jgi:hypothetical protein
MAVSLKLDRPAAITMWDFSWLERRWPGSGYEDWDIALSELKQRGYDAVRIDAYPHLIAVDAEREWELLPCWNQQDWGSPAITRVTIQPNLNKFIAKCGDHGIKVGLSTWFREDRQDQRKLVLNADGQGEIWVKTLASINAAGLIDNILYVDLCNEWPYEGWAPFFKDVPTENGRWDPGAPGSIEWMRRSIEHVRKAYPNLPYCYSTSTDPNFYENIELPFFDLAEPHLWLANSTDFYSLVGYDYERFTTTGYENLVRNGERIYRAGPDHWQGLLREKIQILARNFKHTGLPLITTECWSVVDYKDWPLLDWAWVKELTAFGVEQAVETGQWAAIATSNFCGPQFRGMWRDIDWHLRLTDLIHEGVLPESARK